MDPREMALFARVFHLPAGIAVTYAQPSASELVIGVACHALRMPCPECHQLSARIRGHYQRTVADLPCAGRTVILALTVRKFVCHTPTCPRRIFTELLPGLVQPSARMTGRLIALVQALGLATGGQMGARLADRGAISTTPSTLLRHLMRLPAPVARAVRVLGIDDFAWKKRQRYGTLLVDLERHKSIEVLADRESATVERWLKAHPQVEVVSRAAPQAQQVVDRFHLVRNLAEVLEKILAHCRAEIRQSGSDQPLPEKAVEQATRPLPTPAVWQQRTPAHIEQAHQARQASRDDRFRQLTELRAHGLTQAVIARRIGMSEKAVRTWLKRGAAPTWKRQFRRRSVFDPYAPYVLERWQAGMHEGTQLYEEIREQGFAGTVRIVQRFVKALVDEPSLGHLSPATAAERFSANKAAWLFIRDPTELTTEEQAELDLICQRSATAKPWLIPAFGPDTMHFISISTQSHAGELSSSLALLHSLQRVGSALA